MPERFSLTVLPVSVDPGRPFHVSLHVGPTLTPANPRARTLAAFPAFADWATLMKTAEIVLADQAGKTIAATPLRDAIDPKLWPAVFPGTTPVRAPVTDTLDGRRWKTFPAKAVHDAARATTLLSVGQSAVMPPAPFDSLLGRLMALYVLGPDLADTAVLARTGTALHRAGAALRDYDEGVFARRLDDYVAKATGGNGAVKQPKTPSFEAILAQLHQARRFYERAEMLAEDRYSERPKLRTRQAEKWLSAPPEPDFHERVAHLADLPELLRKLGLVIDLHVDDLDRLAKTKALQASIEIAGADDEPALTPVIRAGSNLLAKPSGGDWRDGRLKLGDPDRFAVMTLDADGSALKLDRFAWTLPRLIRSESQGAPVDAAPPAGRAEGYTVVRQDKLAVTQGQLERARDHVAKREAGSQVTLSAEDVTRGYRIEVWDATAARWFGLHERLIDIDVAGFGQVFENVRSTGHAGGSNAVEDPAGGDGALKLHEALFGWSGWSLAAPRPGPRVRHEAGEELLDRTRDGDTRVTSVSTTIRVAPGTLPRLRYGRSYAFRAWSVDLAGNSPPHPPVAGVPPADDAPGIAPRRRPSVTIAGGAADDAIDAASLSRGIDGALSRQTKRGKPAPAAAALRTALPKPRAAETTIGLLQAGGRSALDAVAAMAPVTGIAAIDRLVTDRLAVRASRQMFEPSRRELVEGAARPLLVDADLDQPARWSVEDLRAVAQGTLDAEIADLSGELQLLSDTITPLLRFLRWEPVPPPAVVPRHRYSEAESVRHLVIRSGVELSEAGGAPTIVDPDSYAADAIAANPALDLAWRATSERHLAPPKSHQMQCELHGRFDPAIGTSDDAARRRYLALALRDDGTLLDLSVASLDDPMAAPTPQQGVILQPPPGATGTPTDLATLVRGAPLKPGEYVIHDVDQLALPYLPDPLAVGLTLRFPDAGGDVPLPPLLGVEAMRTDYRGEWPAAEPYRLVLTGGPALDGRVDGNLITIAVPPGHKLRMRLSSTLARADLSLLGIWDAFPQALKDNDLLAEAAADGWLWALTPSEEVTLTHAVPRPVEAPQPALLLPFRTPGDTGATLAGVVNCHAPSTDRIDVEARWTEWRDELARPGPTTDETFSVACSIAVGEGEDPFIMSFADSTIEVPGLGPVVSHKARHEFGDTRHRTIDYALRGTTRFQDYFPPALIASPDARSLVGPTTHLSIPSSARPAVPKVHSILPLFRWDEETEPHQPFAIRRRRRAGLRIYLERPWYDSGEGELLGVLLGGTGKAADLASQWGADPVWLQRGPADRALGMTVEDLWSAAGLDDRPGLDPRIRPLATVPTAEQAGTIGVLGYAPEFSVERGLWFVDVAITPQAAYWPFVRLSIARYQPASLPGLELSSVVRCDFAQLSPERTMVVGRPDERTVRISVSGATGLRSLGESARTNAVAAAGTSLAETIGRNHRLLAKLERRVPEIASDLGWRVDRVTELAPVGIGADAMVAWLGEVALPEVILPVRPGLDADWRVTVEEWEGIEADPQPFRLDGPLPTAWRLIYADRTAL